LEEFDTSGGEKGYGSNSIIYGTFSIDSAPYLIWSPTGKPVVPQNHTHLRQGFGGSSAGERNPPKHDRLIAEMVYRALTHSSTAKAVVSCVGG